MSIDTANIIILSPAEEVVRWLDPELCDIEEVNEKNSCRRITFTYPYENEEIVEEQALWYNQGNKIYIPAISGITSCLYVINTDYEIDFWKDNKVTVTAEEVLVELNYDVVSFPTTSTINITKNKLDEWFGSYYDILEPDPLKSNRKQVSPEGVMTRMSLLRLVEEQTERTFITSYSYEDGKIKRSLKLTDIDGEDYEAITEVLDLNYNLESLEFVKSEENTYNAMAPILNNSNVLKVSEIESNNVISNQIVAKAENTTSDKTYPELLDEWLAYEVAEGQEIPMILQKNENGDIVETASWSAPFTKQAGELFIKYEGVTRANYNFVEAYNEKKAPFKYKIGTVTTSETIVEAIYNDLATALLGKLQPDFELKIDVKDIQLLLGINNLGYSLHEKLYVKVPNFNYYVPCRIIETTKNLHKPGENKIKISTEVVSISELINTEIISHDVIINTNENDVNVGGTLVANQEALPDQYVTLSIKLMEAFGEGATYSEQGYTTFDPYNETYIFGKEQIINLEKALRNDLFNGFEKTEFRLRDVKGLVYSVPWRWCESIYYAWIQLYADNEYKTDTAYFEDTISVHYYEDALNLARNSNYEASKKYYVSCFYNQFLAYEHDFEEINIQSPNPVYPTLYEDNSGINELLSTMSAIFFTFTPQTDFLEPNSESTYNEVFAKLRERGFDWEAVHLTAENIKKRVISRNSIAFFVVQVNQLLLRYFNDEVYFVNNTGGDHVSILITNWYDDGEDLYLQYCTDLKPFSTPLYAQSNTGLSGWIPADLLISANTFFYNSGTKNFESSNLPVQIGLMMVLTNTEKNKVAAEEVVQMIVQTKEFDPTVKTYKFYIDDIRNAIITNMNANRGNNFETMSMNSTVTGNDKENYKGISMWWLRAASYAYMHYFRTHTEKSNNMLLDIGPDSNAELYYKHFDTSSNVGTYDWFSPCYPEKSQNRLGYICSTLLFNLGFCYSPYDFSSDKNYVDFTEISKIILDKAGSYDGKKCLNAFIVPANSTNISKYLKTVKYDNYMQTVILTYAKSTTLDDTATINQTNYPVMLYSKDGTNVNYMNILANGNSPTNRYNVSVTASGNYNPYGTTSISNMVSWINTVSSELASGDGNNMLVISWNTKTELEAQ